MLLTEIDHVAIAVNDLEAAIDYYRDTFGCEVEHREVVETRRRRRGAARRSPTPTCSCSRRRGPTRPSRSTSRRRARACTTSATGSPTARPGVGVGEGARPPGHRRGAPPRQPGHDGRVRASEDGVRDVDRARPGVTCGPRCRFRFPSDADVLLAAARRGRGPDRSRVGSRPRSRRPVGSTSLQRLLGRIAHRVDDRLRRYRSAGCRGSARTSSPTALARRNRGFRERMRAVHVAVLARADSVARRRGRTVSRSTRRSWGSTTR